jgi:hypothetical protein
MIREGMSKFLLGETLAGEHKDKKKHIYLQLTVDPT